ncbi:cell division cycle protein 16 homolog [Monomorium pharaonis]|uniref:cell division cycle protein 16 homolog n=1 Tax=Monomorium pharaonis TaxID=307658 RepID=UPI001746C56F|nr:cell division cycle protein 16 homolog [Monomorium pharaonis]
MYLMKQYHRAGTSYKEIWIREEAKEYNDALQVINESEICTNITQAGITFADRTDIFQDAPKKCAKFILYVKGRVYEAMDNRAVATECYKQALQCDVYSYEAFEALVQNQMLSASESGNYWSPCHLLNNVRKAKRNFCDCCMIVN